MYVSAGTKVLAGRAGLWEFGDCWGCTHEPGRAGRYRLSGTQTLTIEEINPLSVRADRTEVDPADPVGFTARADEEMRNLEGAFVAGDTFPESGLRAAAVPGGGASFSTAAAPSVLTADWSALASCRGKEACTTPVAVSGRMWVRGHIEHQIIFAKSQIVRVQPVRIKLDCTPNPVTRGNSINCTASAQPAGARITDVRSADVRRTCGGAAFDGCVWIGGLCMGNRSHPAFGRQIFTAAAEVASQQAPAQVKEAAEVVRSAARVALRRKHGCRCSGRHAAGALLRLLTPSASPHRSAAAGPTGAGRCRHGRSPP